jgi:uncharacterized membrane protein YhaH (DUF805 family)
VHYYTDVLKQYGALKGRARREEFWMFYLINFLICSVLYLLTEAIPWIYLLSGLYSLAILLPSASLSVRRLHDLNKSGWWLLVCLAPLVGLVILLMWFCREGTVGKNPFGPDPKAASREFIRSPN